MEREPAPVKALAKAQASQFSEGFIVGCAGPVLKAGLKPVQGFEIKWRDTLHQCYAVIHFPGQAIALSLCPCDVDCHEDCSNSLPAYACRGSAAPFAGLIGLTKGPLVMHAHLVVRDTSLRPTRGCSSVVEHLLAKERAERSNLFIRLIPTIIL